jgi:hypothetical protein
MSGFTTGRIGRVHWLASLMFLAFLLGSTGAFAQAVGPDEVLDAGGAVTQQLALTEAQKAAIYNAVLAHRIRSSAGIPGAVPAVVGAPVSPAVELTGLPDLAAAQASIDDRLATNLKYAMVEDDVVVVDPVRMRVVEVIHRNARR